MILVKSFGSAGLHGLFNLKNVSNKNNISWKFIIWHWKQFILIVQIYQLRSPKGRVSSKNTFYIEYSPKIISAVDKTFCNYDNSQNKVNNPYYFGETAKSIKKN